MTYEIKNAIIKSSSIHVNDHNVLDMVLDLDYGGSCQSFGTYFLYVPKNARNNNILSIAGHFIWRCMEIADVMCVDDLAGKAIRVRTEDRLIVAIGHIIKDDWFCPKHDYKDIK